MCEGTMLFGESTCEAAAVELLDVAYDQGVTFFDTAEMYPFPAKAETQGRSEIILGNWMKNKARQMIICTCDLDSGAITGTQLRCRAKWLVRGESWNGCVAVSIWTDRSLRKHWKEV